MLNFLKGVSWLGLDKIVRMGLGVFVSIAVARKLGVSDFGEFNYVIAFLSLLGNITLLGLHEVVVRELVRAKNDVKKKRDIICAAAAIVTGTTLLVSIFVYTLGILSVPACKSTLGCEMMIIFALCLQIHTIFIMWFEAHRNFDTLTKITLTSYFVSLSIKVLFLVLDFGLIAMIFAYVYEPASLLIIFSIYLIKNNKRRDIYISLNYGYIKELVTRSYPLAFASIATTIAMRVDVIMLQNISGSQDVGLYSAATRVSELWFFLIPIILTVAFQRLDMSQKDHVLFKTISGYLYGVMMYMSLFFALVFFAGSNFIINVLYGNEFQTAANIIRIYCFCGLLVGLSSVFQKILIVKGQEKIVLKLHLVSAVTNIGINYLLIPSYGGYGAAVATVVSYTIGFVVGLLSFKPKFHLAAIYFGLSKTPKLVKSRIFQVK